MPPRRKDPDLAARQDDRGPEVILGRPHVLALDPVASDREARHRRSDVASEAITGRETDTVLIDDLDVDSLGERMRQHDRVGSHAPAGDLQTRRATVGVPDLPEVVVFVHGSPSFCAEVDIYGPVAAGSSRQRVSGSTSFTGRLSQRQAPDSG
jgi:hypothetical protein